jgi:phage terminase large subunit-like protein
VTDTLELVRSLSDDEWDRLAGKLLTGWFPRGRPTQHRPDGDWSVWLILTGRGWGKTRTGAEDLVQAALDNPGDYAVVAPTYGDVRDVCVEGPSGIIAVLARRCIAHTWNRSLGEIHLANGSRVKAGSADEPDRWRGWNFRGGWCDELGAWRRPDAWTQLRLATRIGDRPRLVVTTTPRPTRLVTELAQRTDGSVFVTRGSTWDNAENLSPAALDELRLRYQGTRIGRQELEGELLLDVPGALWSQAMFDTPGFRADDAPDLVRVVTAIDPAVTSGDDSDSTGIVTVGVDAAGDLWVLADDTCRQSPEGWASVAIGALDRWGGDRVVAEVNNGGDLVESVLRAVDRSVPYSPVTASRGKRVRAEPVAALYEQGRVHHVGVFEELEGQMCQWTPDGGSGSPDRLDALVWACTELGLGSRRVLTSRRRAA